MTRRSPGQRTVEVCEHPCPLEKDPRRSPLPLGIRDHVATLVGELRVAGVDVLPSGAGRTAVFDVDAAS